MVYASGGNEAVRSASAKFLYQPYSSEDVPNDAASSLKCLIAHLKSSATSCGDARFNSWSNVSSTPLGLASSVVGAGSADNV